MTKRISLLLCIVLGACGEAEFDLGRGYKYIQLDGRNFAIARPDRYSAVDPNVTRYKVMDPYVVGERVHADIDSRLSQRYGYFVLDMRSGELLEGLDKQAFQEALLARNLDSSAY
jgi:hypothetical protein